MAQNQMQNLTVTKERVLEAASKCSTAKATLQLLFPEAFKPDYPLEVGDIYKGDSRANMLLLQVAWQQDKYILVGSVPNLCFSSNPHDQVMTKSEIETYLTNNNMTFSHNIKANIRKFIG